MESFSLQLHYWEPCFYFIPFSEYQCHNIIFNDEYCLVYKYHHFLNGFFMHNNNVKKINICKVVTKL